MDKGRSGMIFKIYSLVDTRITSGQKKKSISCKEITHTLPCQVWRKKWIRENRNKQGPCIALKLSALIVVYLHLQKREWMIIGIKKTLSSDFKLYSPHFNRAYYEFTYSNIITLFVSEHVYALPIHRDLVTILICIWPTWIWFIKWFM
jgi:hypothetical protein